MPTGTSTTEGGTTNATFRHTKQGRVKLSGDRTWVEKRLHIVLPDEGPMAYSSEGNHVLASLKVPESYNLCHMHWKILGERFVN